MKSNYKIALIGAWLLCCYSGLSQLESEPNNSIANANPIAQDVLTAGDVGIAGDAFDYFLGVPNDEGTITMYFNYTNTSGLTSSDVSIQMYNENGAHLLTKTFSNVALGSTFNDSLVLHCRQADTIYFRINSSGTFSYTTSFSTLSVGIADAEPNNALGEALFLANGAIAKGRVGHASISSDGLDFYYAALPDDGTLEVYTSYNNTSGTTTSDITTNVFRENGSFITSSSNSNQPLGASPIDTITIYCRAADTVFFSIASSGCFSYELSYEVTPSGTLDTEPNNVLADATFFSYGDTAKGRVGYTSVGTDPSDFFFTVLPEDGTLMVFTDYNNTSGTTTADITTNVYRENGSFITSGSNSNQPLGVSPTDTIIIHCRAADTVFFSIVSSGCFSYELGYEVIPSGTLDSEPNNILADALFFASGDTAKGRLGYASVSTDPTDYYFTILPEDGTLLVYTDYINTSGTTTSDITTNVYNENGTFITGTSNSNQPLGSSPTSTITIHCRAADTVYFNVASSGCFSYELSYEVIPSGTPDAEPNDNLANAVFFGANDTAKGRVGYRSVASDPQDFYYTVLPHDGALWVYTSHNNTSGTTTSDITTNFFKENGTFIGNVVKSNQALGQSAVDTAIIYCRAADTVFFSVVSTGCFTYEMSYEMKDIGIPDVEPNNDFTNATLVQLANSYSGITGYQSVSADGSDYYKFYNNGYSEIKWKVNYNNTSGSTSADLVLTAYNPSKAFITNRSLSNRPLGPGMDSIEFSCLPLDTFYLRVQSSAGCFNYSFDFELVSGTFYADADSDNFGNLDSSTYSCSGPPAGFVADNSDCNDNNPNIKPTALEVCDGVDNNCDGQIDEGLFTTSNQNASICQGDSLLIGGFYRKLTGVYIDTVILNNACDSIGIVTLTVNPTDTTRSTTTSSDPLAAGIFTSTLQNRFGCDSILIDTVVYVAPPCPTTDSTEIHIISCNVGDVGSTFTTLQGSDGCDSVVVTVTTHDPGSFGVITPQAICAGDSALIFGVYRKVSGVYSDTVPNKNGCDSILEQELMVNPNYNTSIAPMSICNGDSLLIFGTYQNTSGIYTFNYLTHKGCDSIVSKQLTVNSVINTSTTVSICAGDSILIFGSYQSLAGIHKDINPSVSGCDSIHSITLALKPNSASSANATICDGDSIWLAGTYQKVAGMYKEIYTSSNGCDSVVTTTLIVKPNASSSATAMICDGDSIFLGGAYQTNAGIYKNTYVAANGCDSIVTTTLTVKPNLSTTVMDSICPGDSILLAGVYQTIPGTYKDVFAAVNGCDSTVMTILSLRTDTACGLDTSSQDCLSLVSDNSWYMSTTVTLSNFSGKWNGVSSLPASATFTDPVILGQPYGFASINAIDGTEVISTGNNIRYIRKEFALGSASNLDVRMLTTVDDQADIYVNGQRVALITSFGRANYKFPAHDVKFEGNGTVNNGFIGGDAYDVTTISNLNSFLNPGTNEIIIAIRNLGKTNDKGGISFRMDINCDDSSVKKKSANTTANVGLTVYPNPVSDILTVYTELAISELKLYDLSGKLVMQQSHDAEKEVLIDMQALAQGVYLLEVTELGGEVQVLKIIRE